VISLDALPRFPCGTNKKPLTPNGFYNAVVRVDHSSWPLVGVRTGRLSGIDGLDVDDAEGEAWLADNRYRLPLTREHHTPRGRHLLFAHAAGLRCSASRIALGVDVRADGGYFIDWSREGFAVENASLLAEWPDWLLPLAMKPPGDRGTPIPSKDDGTYGRPPDAAQR
jgi:hypothetical protein